MSELPVVLDFTATSYAKEHADKLENLEKDIAEQKVYEALTSQQINLSVQQIAKSCGVSTKSLEKWEKIIDYKCALAKEVARGLSLTRKEFYGRNLKLITQLFDEIQSRILLDDNLPKIKLERLFEVYRQLANVQLRMLALEMAGGINKSDDGSFNSDILKRMTIQKQQLLKTASNGDITNGHNTEE